MTTDGRTYSVYYKRSVKELNVLKSQKLNRLAALERKIGLSYTDMQEIRRLNEQVRVISVVIAQKQNQMRFDL